MAGPKPMQKTEFGIHHRLESCAMFKENFEKLELFMEEIECVISRYNGTIFAYGQTGSGKTHTMGTGSTVGLSNE